MEELDAKQRRIDELKGMYDSANEQLQSFRQRESTISRAMLESSKAADDVIARAGCEAARLREEAIESVKALEERRRKLCTMIMEDMRRAELSSRGYANELMYLKAELEGKR